MLKALRSAVQELSRLVKHMFKIGIQAQDQDAWELIELLQPPAPRIVFWKAVFDKTTTVKGDLTMLLITDSQEVDLAIKPVTKKGHPAQIDGVPVWSTSDPTIVALVVAADGLSCIATATENLGTVQISVTADADLGEGIQNLTGILDLEVIGGAAATMTIIAGTPREQPA